MDGTLAIEAMDDVDEAGISSQPMVHFATRHGDLHRLTQFAANQFGGIWLSGRNNHYTRFSSSDPEALTEQMGAQIVACMDQIPELRDEAYLQKVYGVEALCITNAALEQMRADPRLLDTVSLGYDTIRDRIESAPPEALTPVYRPVSPAPQRLQHPPLPAATTGRG